MTKQEIVYADFRRQRLFYLVIGVAAMIALMYVLDNESLILYLLEAVFLILAFVQIYLHLRGQRRDIFMRHENGEIKIYRPTLRGSRSISIDVKQVRNVAERDFGAVVSFKLRLASGERLIVSPERLLWMSYDKKVREASKAFFRRMFREDYTHDWS